MGLVDRIIGQASRNSSGYSTGNVTEAPHSGQFRGKRVLSGSVGKIQGCLSPAATPPQWALLRESQFPGLDSGISCHTNRGLVPLPLGCTRH